MSHDATVVGGGAAIVALGVAACIVAFPGAPDQDLGGPIVTSLAEQPADPDGPGDADGAPRPPGADDVSAETEQAAVPDLDAEPAAQPPTPADPAQDSPARADHTDRHSGEAPATGAGDPVVAGAGWTDEGRGGAARGGADRGALRDAGAGSTSDSHPADEAGQTRGDGCDR